MMEIINKLFVAFVTSIPYTFLHFLITYGLHRIKDDDSTNYQDNYGYDFIANFILIFLILLFFRIEV